MPTPDRVTAQVVARTLFSVLGTIDGALDLVPTMQKERQQLADLAEYLRQGLKETGFDTLGSESQIVPVLMHDERKVMEIGGRILDAGFLVGVIRPPTVPRGSARLRISLSAVHSHEQVDAFVAAIRRLRTIEVAG